MCFLPVVDDPESKGVYSVLFAINKGTFNSFLLYISRRVSLKVSLILNTFLAHSHALQSR